MSATTDPNNPGNTLAAAVDAEIAKFRDMQETLHALRGDLQVVMGQQTENEMVQTELNLMDTSSNSSSNNNNNTNNVYKRVGPVLLKQDLSEAKETVAKRLEFIRKEQDKIQAKMLEQEKQLQAQGLKIQEQQANMQRMTAEAVQQIQQQHAAGK